METRPCATCGEGTHAPVDDPEYPWGPCDTCGARALTDAQLWDLERVTGEAAGQALIAACLGYGKTALGVSIANLYGGHWVVVGPKNTIPQWAAAIKEWAPTAEIHIVNAANKTGLLDLKKPKKDTFAFHLMTWEYFRRQSFVGYNKLEGAILDEVHRMSKYGTANVTAANRLDTKRRIALSGTPGRNKLHGLYTVLHWIWFAGKRPTWKFLRFKLWSAWRDKHFQLVERPHFHGVESGWDIAGCYNPQALMAEIPLFIQHLEYDRCCRFHPNGVAATRPRGLPPKIIEVDLTPAQRKLYDRIDDPKRTLLWFDDVDGEGQSNVLLDGGNRWLRKVQTALAVPSTETRIGDDGLPYTAVTMKEDANSASIDALVDLLEDIVDDDRDEPAVVYTHSKVFVKPILDRINKLSNVRAVAWTGDTKGKERDAIKATFGRAGGPNVIVAVVSAISEGTDGLQEVCRQEVWVSLAYDNVFNVQARGRLARGGQKRQVQRYVIIPRDTQIEEDYYRLQREEEELALQLRVPVL